MNCLISIIIPTYNRAYLIEDTLNSIAAQTYTNWECIVVDDGSTDNTKDVVERFAEKDYRFQYHVRPNNRKKGANACRNYGFEISKGDFINWFDDDDIMHSEKLTLQIEKLINTEYNFSVCQSVQFENSVEDVLGHRSEVVISKSPFSDYLMQNIIWLTQAPLWCKQFLEKMSYLFDEELLSAQEWEFHCRVLNICEEYNVVNKPLVYLRKHQASITYNKDNTRTLYHYSLARYKILKNPNIILNIDEKNYLLKIMNDLLKEVIIKRNLKRAFKMLFLLKNVNKDLNFIEVMYAVSGMLSYYFLGKGYIFLKKM